VFDRKEGAWMADLALTARKRGRLMKFQSPVEAAGIE